MPSYDPYEALRPVFNPNGEMGDEEYRDYAQGYLVSFFLEDPISVKATEQIGVNLHAVFNNTLRDDQAKRINKLLTGYAPKSQYVRDNPYSIGGGVDNVVDMSTKIGDASSSPYDGPSVSNPRASTFVPIEDGSAMAVVISSAQDALQMDQAQALSYVLQNTDPAARKDVADAWGTLSDQGRLFSVLHRAGLLTQEQQDIIRDRLENRQELRADVGADEASQSTFGRQLTEQESHDLMVNSQVSIDTGGAGGSSEDRAHDIAVNLQLSEAAGGPETWEGYRVLFPDNLPNQTPEQVHAMLAQQFFLSGDPSVDGNSLYREYSNNTGTTFVHNIAITGIRQYARTSGVQTMTPRGFGRKLDDRLKDDISKIIRDSLLRNFDKLVTSRTGALRVAIEFGKITLVDDPGALIFEFELDYAKADAASRPGSSIDLTEGNAYFKKAKWQNLRTGSTHDVKPSFYGPLVFGGRRGIVSTGPMRFKGADGGWVKTHHIGPAAPRDPFFLDDTGMILAAGTISGRFGLSIAQAISGFSAASLPDTAGVTWPYDS